MVRSQLITCTGDYEKRGESNMARKSTSTP